tara:strand:+ start:1 stop:1305 length:1305 start_codon:yes stop_codon:yes gene_type:complete
MGLIHTIGGLSRTATAALRQLIDAGTLSNLPAGFKARGLRIRDDDDPLQPGEFRDVDAPGGAIRDSLLPLPFKGPDQTLFQLLGFVVDAGRRFATITDMKVGDGNEQAAVGTTLAMLEQGNRVMSAVHKRMHYAMRVEFKILARVMAESLPPVYPYSVSGADQQVKAEDFDDRVDVLPVSNPNIFSQTQRITLAQTELQLAMQAPELHNMPEVYRRVYDAMGVRDIDKILVADTPDEIVPKDPSMENMDVLENGGLRAFKGQNHEAHMMTHLLFMTGGVAAQMPQIQLKLTKHLTEHVRLQAEEQAEQMYAQQNPNAAQQDLTEDLQYQAIVAQMEAQGTQQLRQMGMQVAGEQQGDQQQPDPLIALKQQELQIKQSQVQGDLQMDQAELAMDQQRMQNKASEFQQRLASQERMTGDKIDAAREREILRQRGKQ